LNVFFYIKLNETISAPVIDFPYEEEEPVCYYSTPATKTTTGLKGEEDTTTGNATKIASSFAILILIINCSLYALLL